MLCPYVLVQPLPCIPADVFLHMGRPVVFGMFAGVDVPFVRNIQLGEDGFDLGRGGEFLVVIADVHEDAGARGGRDRLNPVVHFGGVALKYGNGVQADNAEQVWASEPQLQCPACAARHSANSAVTRVGDGAVGFVDEWNQIVREACAEGCPCGGVPVAIVREYDDEGHRFPAHDEVIERVRCAEANPLVGGVGLSVQEVKDGVVFVGMFLVTRRQVNDELLWRVGGFENGRF